MAKFKIGDKVKHMYSGYTGWVHGMASYITGCDRVLINQRKVGKDGKVPEGEWFDDLTLELVHAVKIATPKALRGGPSVNPMPKRGL